ncbi:hypothetical protein B0T25DRAFT_76969 [Lasiosphaeria hispida]|uniref:Uncharacterized protein n=1 Tax=Lasiosphaeria hispida TaxID=260671 RepID=A0AAJ0HPH8_9PEZI|nr:hypothetical protein B0T25DRAFT_76969 [Lasiosphaeria hispida]
MGRLWRYFCGLMTGFARLLEFGGDWCARQELSVMAQDFGQMFCVFGALFWSFFGSKRSPRQRSPGFDRDFPAGGISQAPIAASRMLLSPRFGGQITAPTYKHGEVERKLRPSPIPVDRDPWPVDLQHASGVIDLPRLSSFLQMDFDWGMRGCLHTNILSPARENTTLQIRARHGARLVQREAGSNQFCQEGRAVVRLHIARGRY